MIYKYSNIKYKIIQNSPNVNPKRTTNNKCDRFNILKNVLTFVKFNWLYILINDLRKFSKDNYFMEKEMTYR